MFYCEAMRCTMDERHCIEYQAAVHGSSFASFYVGDLYGLGVVAYRPHCVNCEQGREVAANYKPRTIKGGFSDPAQKEGTMPRECIVEGCKKEIAGQDLCNTHYDKWRRGDPEMIKLKGAKWKQIRFTKRKTSRPATPPASPSPPVRSEVSKGEPAFAGNSQIPIPPFEARLIQLLAERAGEKMDVFFLKCLRTGISMEVGAV